jgi:hypothetical protein
MLLASSTEYPDGLLYVVTTYGKVYAFPAGKAPQESAEPEINTAWSRPGGSNDSSSFKLNQTCGQNDLPGTLYFILMLATMFLLRRRLYS